MNENYRKDFVDGVDALAARYPKHRHVIGKFLIAVELADTEIGAILPSQVDPQRPTYVGELTTLLLRLMADRKDVDRWSNQSAQGSFQMQEPTWAQGAVEQPIPEFYRRR